MEQANNVVQLPSKILQIDGVVSAGTGEEVVDERDEMDSEGKLPHVDYLVKINGDSMDPITRCRKYNSYAGEITPAVPNILSRNFDTSLPNQKWVTDITEFSIPAGKVYLSPIVDCFDGGTPSWSIGTSPNAELVNTMLNTAADTLSESERPIIHSDRGAHYRWPEWIGLINQYGFTRSMSKKSSTPDNAQAESFFGHLKTEFFYNQSWQGKSVQDFMKELNDYLEWYNTKRRKISLGGKSPREYRQAKSA